MAEALNLNYSPEPSLQEGFLDKDTGLPLAFGLVFSWKNESRNVQKPIFTLQQAQSTDPITYTELPNPIVLSGIGTIQDADGNDVIPYFYPFDSLGNVELYYIEVQNEFGIKQFTREAFPNPPNGGVVPAGVTLTNFIPNGQFLLHNGYLTPANGIPYTINPFFDVVNFAYPGLYNVDVFYVAQGGWTFERSTGSPAVDSITFARQPGFDSNDAGSPRFLIDINRTTPHLDPVCDLRIKWNDVFKFSSPPSGTYTLFFNALSFNGPLAGVTLYVIDYFGTGTNAGISNSVQTPLSGASIITIPAMDTQFAIPFTFPPNPNGVTGNNDDDYVQIAIRFPTSASALFHVQLTDFMLIPGMQTADVAFQPETNGQFFQDGSFNTAPNNNIQIPANVMPGTPTNMEEYYYNQGYSLFLPLIQGPQGVSYDFSQIGKIESYSHNVGFGIGPTPSVNIGTNLLLCDGSTYITNNYSPLGIPYRRLLNVLYNPNINMPIYGTGVNFVTCAPYDFAFNVLRIYRNEAFAETPTIVATSNPTGFTYIRRNAGSSGFGIYSVLVGTSASSVAAQGNVKGLTANQIADGSSPTGFLAINQNINQTDLRQIFSFQATAGAAIPQSSFIQFGITTTAEFIWFNINGGGTQPVAGVGTPIQCQISTSMDDTDVANVVAETLNGWEISDITIGTTPPASSFFTFFARGLAYNVWYTVDGAGTPPPSPTGANIRIDILSSDNAVTIGVKTEIQINTYQFAVPQLGGVFLRGFDPNSLIDPESSDRFSLTNGSFTKGDTLGTYQFQNSMQHVHWASIPGSASIGFVLNSGAVSANVTTGGGAEFLSSVTGYNSSTFDIADVTNPSVGAETRPYNMYVNYVIRY